MCYSLLLYASCRITEALVAANDYLLIPGRDGYVFFYFGQSTVFSWFYREVKMSEAIDDPVALTRLTDQVLQQIQISSDPNLQEVM